jgi:hypothetical protein
MYNFDIEHKVNNRMAVAPYLAFINEYRNYAIY